MNALTRADRRVAATLLRIVRHRPYRLSPWDQCVCAGTEARIAGDMGAYEAIKAVAIKFPPKATKRKAR